MCMVRLVSAALAAVAAWGCTPREPDWKGNVSDSAGITVVSYPAEGIWADSDRWSLLEELRIG